MMITAIPLYAIQLGGNNSTAGLMMGLFMTAAILIRPVFGILADTKSRRIVLLIGSVICIMACSAYPFVVSIGMLMFFRAINGMGFSAYTNASGTVVADLIPKSRLAEGIGFYGISNVLASAVGPALTLTIIRHFGFAVLFIIATASGVIGFICSYFMKYEKKEPNKAPLEDIENNTDAKRNVWGSIFEKTAFAPSFVMLFVAFTTGSIQSFIPIYAATRDIGNIGIYFIVYALALFITRIGGGKIADRYGAPIVFLPGYILLIASFILLAFASNITMFIISGILYGLGYGSVQPLLNAVMVQFCPPSKRGAGNSTFFTAMDVGSGGGAVVWGAISQYFGFTLVYLLCVGCVILSWIFYFFLLHRTLQKTHQAKEAFVTP